MGFFVPPRPNLDLLSKPRLRYESDNWILPSSWFGHDIELARVLRARSYDPDAPAAPEWLDLDGYEPDGNEITDASTADASPHCLVLSGGATELLRMVS